MNILIGAVIFIALWSLWGYFSSRVEQAKYTVIKKTADYEIRNYPAHIVAQTTVHGSYNKALNEGFRILARYIFGGNVKKESIAMTAPVIDQKELLGKIAMTAPVLASTEGKTHVISFGMPRSYTLKTLPTPTDSRVKIIEVPAKTFAVLRFSWYRTDARIKKMEKKLLAALSHKKLATKGSPIFAGYNAPWTPPWMVRNEVMIEVVR
jgi:hypothetical protein